jgi:hypothetical protein
MLFLTKEQLALKECVEKQVKDQILTVARPPTAVDEGCPDAGVQAPIKIVDGHPWSPGIYQALL